VQGGALAESDAEESVAVQPRQLGLPLEQIRLILSGDVA
jgi:hypothetical protein